MKEIRKGLDFVYTFILCWITGVYLHEWSHALVGRALGWTASIGFPNPFAGWTSFPEWQSIPLSNVILIALAGGLGTCILFIIWAYFTTDWEHDMALYYFAGTHAIYSVFEVGYVLHKVSVQVLGITPPLLALIPLAYMYLR